MSEDAERTLEEIEEARAEEEFISAPEDTVNNPLVPANAGGVAISSGNFAHDDFTGGSDMPINNETNIKEEIVGNSEGSIFDKPKEAVPAPAAAPAMQPVAAEPKKKSKAGLIVTICILAALLIGGGVFCLFFFVLRSTPANLVNDSVNNLLTAENFNVSFKINPMDMKLSKSGSNFGMSGDVSFGSSLGVSLDVVSTKDDNSAYIKATGLDNQLVAMTLGAMIAGNNNGYSAASTVMGMNNVWYKASADDIKGINSEYACGFEYDKFFANDGLKVFADAYKANSFFVPKEGAEVKEENGKKVITVTVDKDKLKAFKEAIRSSDKYAISDSCRSTGDDIIKDLDKGEVALTIDGSKLVGIKIQDKDFATIDYEKKDISVPSDAKSLADALKKIKEGSGSSNGGSGLSGLGDLSGLFGGLFGNLLGGGADVTDDDTDTDTDLNSLFGGDSDDSGDSIDFSDLFKNLGSGFDDDSDDDSGDDMDWSSLLNLFSQE